LFFFFKQKTAYEILDGDWSSDVCSSDLLTLNLGRLPPGAYQVKTTISGLPSTNPGNITLPFSLK
jgi:hypothetical protein